jgi:hypothetical protein
MIAFESKRGGNAGWHDHQACLASAVFAHLIPVDNFVGVCFADVQLQPRCDHPVPRSRRREERINSKSEIQNGSLPSPSSKFSHRPITQQEIHHVMDSGSADSAR